MPCCRASEPADVGSAVPEDGRGFHGFCVGGPYHIDDVTGPHSGEVGEDVCGVLVPGEGVSGGFGFREGVGRSSQDLFGDSGQRGPEGGRGVLG